MKPSEMMIERIVIALSCGNKALHAGKGRDFRFANDGLGALGCPRRTVRAMSDHDKLDTAARTRAAVATRALEVENSAHLVGSEGGGVWKIEIGRREFV